MHDIQYWGLSLSETELCSHCKHIVTQHEVRNVWISDHRVKVHAYIDMLKQTYTWCYTCSTLSSELPSLFQIGCSQVISWTEYGIFSSHWRARLPVYQQCFKLNTYWIYIWHKKHLVICKKYMHLCYGVHICKKQHTCTEAAIKWTWSPCCY